MIQTPTPDADPPRRAAPQGLRRRMLTWLGILAGIYGSWLVLLYLLQTSMMWPRHLAGPPMPGPQRGVESLWIDAEESGNPIRVEGWFIPAPGASPERPAPLLVFFHGNGELMDGCLDVAGEWRSRGFSVLLHEYRGYGRSGGTPSEAGIVPDAVRMIELACARPDVDPARVVLHGRSIGAAVAAQVAVRRPVAAMVMQSTFTSAASFAPRVLAPPALLKSPFRTDRALAAYDRPVLILHGARDEIVAPSHGRALHRIIPGSVYIELPGRHNDFPLDEVAYWQAIETFLARHGLLPRG